MREEGCVGHNDMPLTIGLGHAVTLIPIPWSPPCLFFFLRGYSSISQNVLLNKIPRVSLILGLCPISTLMA